MRILLSMTVAVPLMVCVGCESSAPSTPSTVGFTAPPPPQPAAPAAPPAEDGEEGAAADGAADDGAAAAEAAEPAAVETDNPPTDAPAGEPAEGPPPATTDGTLKKAEAGVGVKGRDYGGPGFVTTPVAAKFTIEQRIAFEAQIPNAMKIYKAAHDNKGPKTHEEFMEVIIKENGVNLPELPFGETYLYVPETEELMVKVPQAEEQ